MATDVQLESRGCDILVGRENGAGWRCRCPVSIDRLIPLQPDTTTTTTTTTTPLVMTASAAGRDLTSLGQLAGSSRYCSTHHYVDRRKK